MHNFLGGDTPPALRSHPLLAFSPKYSALICSRTNLPRSRKARLPAPGSAQSSLGTVVSSLPTDQREHPESSRGGAAPPPQWAGSSGFIGPKQRNLSGWGGLIVGPGDPGEAGTTFPKMSRAGFRSAPGVETRDWGLPCRLEEGKHLAGLLREAGGGGVWGVSFWVCRWPPWPPN